MSRPVAPSPELLAGRRALESLSGLTILDDWSWNSQIGKWVLHCRLEPGICSTELVPASTVWFVVVDSLYPWGPIKFYPARANGITATFPHQSRNHDLNSELPWRAGDMCLDTQVHVLGRNGFDTEPYSEHERLRWRFERALDWLRAASRGELAMEGEPYELPVFPIALDEPRVVFSESKESLPIWSRLPDQVGLVDIGYREPGLAYVKAFRTAQEQEIMRPAWGGWLQKEEPNAISPKGAWLKLRATPVNPPWQAPASRAALYAAVRKEGQGLDPLLRRIARHLRDGRTHIILIGFPIPKVVGGQEAQMHWQALQLKPLAVGNSAPKGFRPNELGHWEQDRKSVLQGEETIRWLRSENWHDEQLRTRGQLDRGLVDAQVLVLGAGALGSAISEILIRGGVKFMTIIDDDTLEAGNLVRHSLTLTNVGNHKASAVAQRLNEISPSAHVVAIDADFPFVPDDSLGLVREADVVIDCTGDDSVLAHVGRFPWKKTARFCSISLGFGGRRIFFYTSSLPNFSHKEFQMAIRPWLDKEAGEYAGEELPREGIGCWHPVFPARSDDIWLAASIAVKHIEAAVTGLLTGSQLLVFEAAYENGLLTGLRRVMAA